MQFGRATLGAAVLMAVSAFGARAQSVNVTGNTQGCFDYACEVRDPSGNSLSFAGTDFNWAAVANTPQTVDLGTLTVTGNGLFGLGGFDDSFLLQTNITDPVVAPGSHSYAANIFGNFVFEPGNLTVDFDNSTKKYEFNGGSLLLNVNDMTFTEDGTQHVYGTLTYVPTTTPEPASLALVGTGLVGLIPLVRLKRKNSK